MLSLFLLFVGWFSIIYLLFLDRVLCHPRQVYTKYVSEDSFWTFDFPSFTSWILKLCICTTMPGCLFTCLLICMFVHSFCSIWDWTWSLIYAKGALSSWVVLTTLSLFVTLIYLLRWTLVVILLPWFQRRWDYQSVPLGLDPFSVRAIVHVQLHWEMFSPFPF